MKRRVLHILPTLAWSGAGRQVLLLAEGLPRDAFELQVVALDSGGPILSALRDTGTPVCTLGRGGSVDPLCWWKLRQFKRAWRPDVVQWWLSREACAGRGNAAGYTDRLARQTVPQGAAILSKAPGPGLLQKQAESLSGKRPNAGGQAHFASRSPQNESVPDRFRIASENPEPPRRPTRGKTIAVGRHFGTDDGWAGTMDRLLARRADRVVVNSSALRDDYIRRGVADERIELIPSAAFNAAGALSFDVSVRRALLKELELPDDARLIGVVGNLRRDHRLFDLIWVAELLKIIYRDTHLLVIGDGPFRARLEQFRGSVRIEDRVHFLGPRNDVDRLLPCLEVVWLAHELGGCPCSLLEAMAAGLPVVAVDSASHRQIVEHGTTGFLVPCGDRAEFARFTHKLLQDTALRQQLGAAGRARVAANFSANRLVERFAGLYGSA